MNMHARVADGVVAELIPDEVDGIPLADRYHPAFVAALVPAQDGVQPGWQWTDGEFQPPPPVPGPPPPSRVITPRQFMDRLPMERQAAITTAAVASPQILLWLIRLTGAIEVDLDNAETMEGVQTLALGEVITETEAQALLA